MARVIDLYWDLGSTNSYFAIKLLQPIVARHDAEIRWHAFNVGHVFQANNYVLMDEPKAKLKNRKDDLMRWARKYQLPFSVPRLFLSRPVVRCAAPLPCDHGIKRKRLSTLSLLLIGSRVMAGSVTTPDCVRSRPHWMWIQMNLKRRPRVNLLELN